MYNCLFSLGGGGGIFIVFWFIITMNSAWVQRKYLTFPLNLLKPPLEMSIGKKVENRPPKVIIFVLNIVLVFMLTLK